MKYLSDEPSPFTRVAPRRAMMELDEIDEMEQEVVADFAVSSSRRVGRTVMASALSILAVAGGAFAMNSAMASDSSTLEAVPAVVKPTDDSTITNRVSRDASRRPMLIVPTASKSPKLVSPSPSVTKASITPSKKSTPAPTSSATPTKNPIVKVVTSSPSVGSSVSVGNGRLAHPLPGAPLTSKFGPRFHPVLHVMRFHTGVDFANGCGRDVISAGDGVVTSVGWAGGYGNRVVVKHTNDVSTTYNHLSSASVSVGQVVRTGDKIGDEGTTGWSTGCHLHFEVVYKGSYVDPMPWLDGRGGDGRGVSAGDLTVRQPIRDSKARVTDKEAAKEAVPVEKARPVVVKEHETVKPVRTPNPTPEPKESNTPSPSMNPSPSQSTPENTTTPEPTSTPTPTGTQQSPTPSGTPTSKATPSMVPSTPAAGPTRTSVPTSTRSITLSPSSSTRVSSSASSEPISTASEKTVTQQSTGAKSVEPVDENAVSGS